VEVAAGATHSTARRSDGSVVAWAMGAVSPPVPAGNYIGIAAGSNGSALLRSDGNVIPLGTSAPPPLPPGLRYEQLAGGQDPSDGSDLWSARRSDGSLVTWNPTLSVPVPTLPAGVTFADVAVGAWFAAALLSDGNLAVFGWHSPGPAPSLPQGLAYVGVAAGEEFAMATRSDGVAVAWGSQWANPHQLQLPQLAPGEVLAQLSVYRDRCVALVRNGSYRTFAPGCPGSAGITHLAAAAPPRLGGTLSVTMSPVPGPIAVFCAGLSNLTSTLGPLPLALSPYGMLGCSLRVSPDASVLLVGSGGSANCMLGVPALPALAGMLLYQQALVWDPSAANAAGLVMSDAATALIGP
jgi:hypothetical protein